MRLTCPNCDAQYEVPDEVIPPEGRDVQCSNCGNTWYQDHPDHPELALDDVDDYADEFDDVEDEDDEDEDIPEPAHRPEPAPARRPDPGVAGILREEAEREARLRAAETLESQPDLGLESHEDPASSRRAREARERMARIRGKEPTPAAPKSENGPRRGLLPDIEEINSTLRASGDGGPGTEVSTIRAEPMPETTPKKGGFMRGFALTVIVAVVLWLIYAKSREIAAAVPQADPMLSAYVALVDQARVWLDSQINALIPR